MNEKLIINQVSIARKGLAPKTYLLPSAVDFLTDGSIKSNHIDWESVREYLNTLYVPQDTFTNKIALIENDIPKLEIDSTTGNLKYNSRFFLNVANYTSDLLDLQDAMNALQSNISTINTTLNGLDLLYASKSHSHTLLGDTISDVTKVGDYLKIENNNSFKYVELLSDELVTLSAEPQGLGKVYVTPKVRKGGKAVLVAEPDQGYKFVNWVLNANEISTNPIHILSNVTVGATYFGFFAEDSGSSDEPEPTVTYYTLTISEPTYGNIIAKVNGEGNNLGYDEEILLPLSTTITLLAQPNPHCHFVEWGDAIPSSAKYNLQTSITLNAQTTIAATFAKDQHRVTIEAATDTDNQLLSGNHYPTATVGGVTQTSHTFDVDHNTTVHLEANTPINDYYFKCWSDNVQETNENRDISIVNDLTIHPIYEQAVPEHISIEFGQRINGSWHIFDTSLVAVELNGNVIANPYDAGTYVNIDSDDLTATGYQFVQWEDANHEVIEEGGTLEKDSTLGTHYYGTFNALPVIDDTIYYYTSGVATDTSIGGKEGTAIQLSTLNDKYYIDFSNSSTTIQVLTIVSPSAVGAIKIFAKPAIGDPYDATSEFTPTNNSGSYIYLKIARNIKGPYYLQVDNV